MENNRYGIMLIVFGSFLLMGATAWLPIGGQSSLLESMLFSLVCLFIACLWLFFNLRYPKHLTKLLHFARSHANVVGAVIILLAIGGIDILLYEVGLSPLAHFHHIAEWIILGVISGGGLLLSFLHLKSPHLAHISISDSVINVTTGCFVIAWAWLILPLAASGFITIFTITYLILLSFFPWLPQFRQRQTKEVETK